MTNDKSDKVFTTKTTPFYVLRLFDKSCKFPEAIIAISIRVGNGKFSGNNQAGTENWQLQSRTCQVCEAVKMIGPDRPRTLFLGESSFLVTFFVFTAKVTNCNDLYRNSTFVHDSQGDFKTKPAEATSFGLGQG